MPDTTHKSYRFRLYPNKTQAALIAKTFGCCRFVHNALLEHCEKTYRETGKSVYLTSQMLTELKRTTVDKDGNMWLYEPDANALVYELRRLNEAYRRFFANIKKGIHPAGAPKFRSRYAHKSYSTQNNVKRDAIVIDYEHKRVKLPKLGWVKVKPHRPVEGEIVSATITQESDDKYFISLCCQDVPQPTATKPINDAVVVEVGLRHHIILSDGRHIDKPASLDALDKRIRAEQHKLSRMQGGANLKDGQKPSKRYRKQLKLINTLRAKQRRIRLDITHKTSHMLVNEYDHIFMRDTNVRELLTNEGHERQIPRVMERDLHRRLADASFTELKRQLEYKTQWYGRSLTLVDSATPTTQQCSVCGYQNTALADKQGLGITH